MNRAHWVSWVLTGIGICGYVAAAETLPPTLRACMSESDSVRRLACFDRESARLVDTSAPVAHRADPPAAPPASAQEKFGYRGDIARADIDKQQAQARTEFEEMTARIAELATLPRGELRLTLDNGQVWQQKTGDRGMRVRVGDEVTIKRASLGSFLLSSGSANGVMRVTRVK